MSDEQTVPDEQNPEEMLREMARQLAAVPVRDILLQSMGTFADLAGVRMGFGPDGAEHRDLPQARLAIETLRAMIGVIETELGAAQARPFREPLAQLQMLYAREVDADAKRAAEPAEGSQEDPSTGLWTPGGQQGGEGGPGIWTPGT